MGEPSGEGTFEEKNPEQGERLDPAGLEEYLVSLVDLLHTSQELENLPVVSTADINQEFFVNALVPVQPPSFSIEPPEIERELSETDKRELELLQQNGGNPVIKTE